MVWSLAASFPLGDDDRVDVFDLLATLRAEGLDDRAIHDAVQVVGYFNYITRVADALGVEAEDSIGSFGVRFGMGSGVRAVVKPC